VWRSAIDLAIEDAADFPELRREIERLRDAVTQVSFVRRDGPTGEAV
jgi:hypothetical protein